MRVLSDDLSDTKKSSTVHEFNHVFLQQIQSSTEHIEIPPLLDERQIVLQQHKDNCKTLLKHFSLFELLISPKEPYKQLLVR